MEAVAHACWRFVSHGAGDGPWNMAVDEAIARAVGQGRVPPTLRLYEWREATVSLGYLQRATDAVDLEACRRYGVPIVRRPTGGRAVLHARELTYSLALPAGGIWGELSVAASFERIGRGLLAGLRRLGVAATIGEGKVDRSGPRGRAACFQLRGAPAIVVAGRKLVGSAQRRWGQSSLQHGSLLLEFDAGLHRAIFPAGPRAESDKEVVWLKALLPDGCSPGRIREAILAGCSEALEVVFASDGLSPLEAQEAERLVAVQYAAPAWTFRR